jgi:outer membrane protein assembly factor BamB
LWTAKEKAGGKSVIGSMHVASAPVCVGESVLVTGILSRGERGDDYYLVCLNAADGTPRYVTFLCTRIASVKGGEVLYPPAPAVMSDGTIYVATNAGAVCAVDMMSGRLRWVSLYDRKNSVAASPGGSRFERAIRREVSFAYGAPVVSGGTLIVAPPEVDSLIALDAEKGDALWMLDNSDRRFAYLLGAREGAVILSGEKIGAFDIRTGKPWWGAEPDLGAGVAGAGYLAGDFIVLPADGIITVVDARNGAVVSRTAVKTLLKPPVPEKISAFTGNLLPGGEKIFSISRERIAVYAARRSEKVE